MRVGLEFPGIKAHAAAPILALGLMALLADTPAAAADAPAQAQAASTANTAASPPGAGATTLQEVVVTGTSISGGNAQVALPVQTLSASDIARTGATSVPQLLQEVSAVSSVG